MTTQSVKWILFDLGNVLVDYRPGGFTRAAEALGVPVEQLNAFFGDSGAGELLTTGTLTPRQFVDLLNHRFRSSVTPSDVVRWFGPEVATVYPEVPPIVRSLKGEYSLGILSNTFFGHWDYFIATDLARLFDAPMASHLLGFSKPDPRVYRAALNSIGATAAETLFVDDRPENVDAAVRLGFKAFQATTPTELILVLRGAGVLRDGD